MSRRDFFQIFCMFYLQCITRKCAKEKKQQYLMLYQTWNRTSVYFKLALSASYQYCCIFWKYHSFHTFYDSFVGNTGGGNAKISTNMFHIRNNHFITLLQNHKKKLPLIYLYTCYKYKRWKCGMPKEGSGILLQWQAWEKDALNDDDEGDHNDTII